MPPSPSNGAPKVPKEFFCPISGQFMEDPVIDPSTQQTCDRQSLLDNNKISGGEILKVDYDLREKSKEWRLQYKLAPTFAFVKTPAHLTAAVNSLLNPTQISWMNDLDLLERLRQLKSEIQYRSSVIASKDGVLTLCKLIAGCPFKTNHIFIAEWVKISVCILGQAHYIHQIDFDEIHTQMLTLIDEACPRIIHDRFFRAGLVNLMYSIWTHNNKRQILGSHEIIKFLTHTMLSLQDSDPVDFFKMYLERLFMIITELSSLDRACSENPRLAQVLVSLVWPMQSKLEEEQYLHLLETISSILKTIPEEEDFSTLIAMTRPGLVAQIFSVLEYAIVDNGAIETIFTVENAREQILLRSFEILYLLSLSRIGRIEIVRVVRASGYAYLDCFSSALHANTEDMERDYMLPLLGILSNITESARFTPFLVGNTEGDLIDCLTMLLYQGNLQVQELATKILDRYNQVKKGENSYRPPEF